MNENNNLNINNDQVQNINTHVVNQDINNVIAINEVKIESDTVIPEVSNEIPTVSNNNEPPKNSKVSTILLVLLFIFLFGFVMGMPYINEFINNLKNDNSLSEIEQEAIREEEKQQQEQQNQKPVEVPEKEKTTLLTCTINSASNNEYSLVQIQKFNYNSNNQILSSSSIYQYTFKNINESYNTLKTQCDEDSLKYVTHEGYTMTCIYGDMNIEIGHEFDLDTFDPIVDGDTNIQANASFKQDINTVKDSLINLGYSCE